MTTTPALWHQSLVHRLVRALTAAVLLVWLLSTAILAWYVDRRIQENFDVELIESTYRQLYPALLELQMGYAQPHIEAALQAAHQADDPLVMGELPGFDHSEPLLLQLRQSPSKVLLRTKATPASPFAVPMQPGFFNTPDYRVFSLYDQQYDVWLQLADPLEERRETRQRTIAGLGLVLLVMLPVIATLITLIARRELRSIGLLQQQITARSGSNLQPISVQAMPTELQIVGDGVNQLLERLGAALNVERSLAANAAHELRTPLAEVRLRLHMAIDQATPTTGVPLPEVQAALQSLEILRHRTERLLQLSRAEGGDSAHFGPVDLVHLAEQVAQEFWQANQHVQKRLDCIPPETQHAVWVWGDIDSLAIALRNLIDNALKHSTGHVEVEVQTQPSPALVVKDSGAGLGPTEIQRIVERHARLDSQHIGYGLGMSIVKTIVHKHGAALHLQSPPSAMAHGLEVAIRFAAPSQMPTETAAAPPKHETPRPSKTDDGGTAKP